MSSFAVILPAAGRSSRFGGKHKKPFAQLSGRAVWLRAVEPFVTRTDLAQAMVVIAPEDEERFQDKFGPNLMFLDVKVVLGGAERFESVANALAQVEESVDFVAVHDAVRPCISAELIAKVFDAAVQHGAALPALALSDTLKKVGKEMTVQATPPRDGLWLAQTPQVFRRDWLVEAYAKRDQIKEKITDDAQLVESLGHPVHIVPGEPFNLKITTHDDLKLAEAVIKMRESAPAAKVSRHPFADEQF